ncbi:hypothetical protein [Mammaliicoccus lentus]|uniref:hypothetical protein n=1 Tax=Mammaliicoccus lentus TaxID=42858 RepID=UPI002DB69DFD|nr:hypothetical protein [Mammaliicoccus lentus]MEB5686337.1 hypothetical protein [Mammaliicoccus lentus]
MERLLVMTIVILLTISLGVFFNYLINPPGKRISMKKILSVRLILDVFIGLFFYWQQVIGI